jgi:hypothetical protein
METTEIKREQLYKIKSDLDAFLQLDGQKLLLLQNKLDDESIIDNKNFEEIISNMQITMKLLTQAKVNIDNILGLVL